MSATVEFTLNGRPARVETDPERRLLWVLRTDLQLTGTKYGCGEGQCGACTVVVDGRAVRSCLVLLRSVEGKTVITIEGLAANGKLHPLQSAFVAHDALQCGICIPGMLMNAYALLVRHPDPSREQILRGMEGSLCRCGAYRRILAAIQSAARTMREA